MHEPFATCPGRKEYRFGNGLGAVVRERDNLFELAVLGPDGDICTDTEGPNGVYRFEPADQVEALLDQIAALNPIVSWRLLDCGHGMAALSSIPTNQLKCPALCDLA